MRPDRIADTLQETYGWHPLMNNIILKTHDYFKENGLEPMTMPLINPYSAYNTSQLKVAYVDPDLHIENRAKAKKESIKSTAFKNNGLILCLPNLFLAQINTIPNTMDQVNIYCKQIGGYIAQIGIIRELTSQKEGHFNEARLEYFLKKCLTGDFSPSTPPSYRLNS